MSRSERKSDVVDVHRNPGLWQGPLGRYRRLSLTGRKVRGVRRRMHALRKWSTAFEGWFPDGLVAGAPDLYFKLPVYESMVDGRRARPAVRRECAQLVIDACVRLTAAKRQCGAPWPVVAIVNATRLFMSDVTICTREESLPNWLGARDDEHVVQVPIQARSLAQEWDLVVPEGMHEVGVVARYCDGDEESGWDVQECWFFTEAAE